MDEMRVFETGATRGPEEGKHDPEGFLSPRVIVAFNEYMHKHRFQADGQIRDSDNWQKGIPKDAYMKSMWRHFLDIWLHHRYQEHKAQEPLVEALTALMFNVMGYLDVVLKEQDTQTCDAGLISSLRSSESLNDNSDRLGEYGGGGVR